MSLPLKRNRESLTESNGPVAPGLNNLGRGNTSRRRGNGRGNGRGRDRGPGRGRSFHIPKGASQTALLTEVWRHRTHGTYALSSQLHPVPRSPPKSPQTVDLESPIHNQPQPGLIAATPELLHGPTESVQSSNLDEFVDFSEHQNAQSIHPRTVHRPNGPLRQICGKR